MTRDRFARFTVVLAVCAGVAACGKSNQYAAPPPPKVTVAAPIEQNVTRYFEATGNTAAVNSVDLVARVQGFVQAISYKDGDYVKKGTSLFTIEPEPYKLKVESAKAAVVSAQATLTQAQAEYDRQAALVAKQVSTQANYDKALAQRDSAQADLQSAQANERQAEINLSYTDVTAPFDGVVTARQVSIGQLVGASSPTTLATIVQLDPIWVNFTASERDVLQVRATLASRGETTAALLGLPVEVGLQNESGYPHPGKLDYVAPNVDPSTGTLAARASPSTVACLSVRASITSHIRESTFAVSPRDSRPPRCISPGLRYSAWPPSFAIATSKETLVRVEGSSKIIPSERWRRSSGTAASKSACLSSLMRLINSSSSPRENSWVSMKFFIGG